MEENKDILSTHSPDGSGVIRFGIPDGIHRLIIIGSAPCAIDDVYAAIKMMESENGYSECHYCAIGLDAVNIARWPIQYFATYHPSEIADAHERRRQKGGNVDYTVISHVQHDDQVDMIVPFEQPSGSSALLGVLAGIKMGYEKIIVCGCPLTGKNDKGYDYANFREGWKAKYDEIKAVARAMSGWPMELLGLPSKEWLKGEEF